LKLTVDTLEAAAKSKLKSQILIKTLILELRLGGADVPWLDIDECEMCCKRSQDVSKRFIIAQLCGGCDK